MMPSQESAGEIIEIGQRFQSPVYDPTGERRVGVSVSLHNISILMVLRIVLTSCVSQLIPSARVYV